ncbi:hypothetical protein [Sphingorhabdus sp. M41]|uniref:hypothetical protein n=1 Tax=Sphingorhabdus sp. M41 TaxID=1806885 RepID=UPI00078B21D5|nr:hypothetical protein [Sphingorhabdus sp. M41]AMO72061.1 hypothetical protein AZE99_09555 [Sphingorhabdus sp. M41]
MAGQNEYESRLSTYGKIGVSVSLIIALFFSGYFISEWEHIKAMTPNEFGDLLAGILGPLALLWLVLGFFQQGEELRQSVRALELQSEELRNSVTQQAALVEVTREQAQAELAALHEERQARRAATSPRFTIHANGGSRSGQILKQSIALHNVGAMASDVQVTIKTDDLVHFERFFSVLEEGSRQNFSLDYQIDDRPEQMTVSITSRNRFGEEVAQIIRLNADQENLLSFSSVDITA